MDEEQLTKSQKWLGVFCPPLAGELNEGKMAPQVATMTTVLPPDTSGGAQKPTGRHSSSVRRAALLFPRNPNSSCQQFLVKKYCQ